MKKLVFVIFILQSICSYGQPQRLQANRSDFGKTNKNSKNVILDTGTYFFTNGRTSKRVSRLSSAANSVKKTDRIVPILEKSFNIAVQQEGNYFF